MDPQEVYFLLTAGSATSRRTATKTLAQPTHRLCTSPSYERRTRSAKSSRPASSWSTSSVTSWVPRCGSPRPSSPRKRTNSPGRTSTPRTRWSSARPALHRPLIALECKLRQIFMGEGRMAFGEVRCGGMVASTSRCCAPSAGSGQANAYPSPTRTNWFCPRRSPASSPITLGASRKGQSERCHRSLIHSCAEVGKVCPAKRKGKT